MEGGEGVVVDEEGGEGEWVGGEERMDTGMMDSSFRVEQRTRRILRRFASLHLLRPNSISAPASPVALLAQSNPQSLQAPQFPPKPGPASLAHPTVPSSTVYSTSHSRSPAAISVSPQSPPSSSPPSPYSQSPSSTTPPIPPPRNPGSSSAPRPPTKARRSPLGSSARRVRKQWGIFRRNRMRRRGLGRRREGRERRIGRSCRGALGGRR